MWTAIEKQKRSTDMNRIVPCIRCDQSAMEAAERYVWIVVMGFRDVKRTG